MPEIIGIDLGTTHSLAGAMLDGFPVLFADEDGSRLLPSLVAYPPGHPPVTGRRALRYPDVLIRSVKRWMGARAGEAPPPPFLDRENLMPAAPVAFRVGGRRISPEEVSAEILRELKCRAERALGHSVSKAVITVPAYFNDAQRAATKRAGELAGLEVVRLLPEPTAAALAFGLGRPGAKIAVFDLGGGTFDISILDFEEGVFHVLATCGDTRLGGDDFDAVIAAELGISQAEAEEIKRRAVDSGDASLLARIERVCAPVAERVRAHCERALLDSGVAREQLDAVILVGGATRLPLVRRLAAEIFGQEPDVSQPPDEAVALGATIQAGVLEGSVQAVTLLDVTPLSLGIETFGGLMNVIIPRNTTIPAKAGEIFTNAAAGQAAMRIRVLQGEREMAKDNWALGEFVIEFPPAPRGQARVGVQFELDTNGILRVLARDLTTGREKTLEVSSAIEISDEAVEKMLADSLEHAFDDMDERRWVEAKLKAEEMLPAAESALVAHPPDDPAERQAIEAAMEAVRKAVGSGSLPELLAAIDALDHATAPLAARILEHLLQKSSS